MEKIIKLNRNDARNLYKTNPELRDTILKEFSNRELGINTFPESWESLKIIFGSCIDTHARVRNGLTLNVMESNKNLIPTREDAESQLAESQLRQLAKVINDNETEEEWINWHDDNQYKFHAYYDDIENILSTSINSRSNYKNIYFKRKEDIERSLVNHKRLWLQYFKVI